MHTVLTEQKSSEVTIPVIGALVGVVFILVILCAGALILVYCWKKVRKSVTKYKVVYQGNTMKQEDIQSKEPLAE